jgi:hypothetical protein
MQEYENTVCIPLNQGKHALIDADDFGTVGQFRWWIDSVGYAHTFIRVRPGERRTVRLHRMIMREPELLQVDHLNTDRLDNRKCNLRLCDRKENSRNRNTNRGSKRSRYKGVTQHQGSPRWIARIRIGVKKLNLGVFDSENDAATAYNMAALHYYREYAKLNWIN